MPGCSDTSPYAHLPYYVDFCSLDLSPGNPAGPVKYEDIVYSDKFYLIFFLKEFAFYSLKKEAGEEELAHWEDVWKQECADAANLPVCMQQVVLEKTKDQSFMSDLAEFWKPHIAVVRNHLLNLKGELEMLLSLMDKRQQGDPLWKAGWDTFKEDAYKVKEVIPPPPNNGNNPGQGNTECSTLLTPLHLDTICLRRQALMVWTEANRQVPWSILELPMMTQLALVVGTSTGNDPSCGWDLVSSFEATSVVGFYVLTGSFKRDGILCTANHVSWLYDTNPLDAWETAQRYVHKSDYSWTEKTKNSKDWFGLDEDNSILKAVVHDLPDWAFRTIGLARDFVVGPMFMKSIEGKNKETQQIWNCNTKLDILDETADSLVSLRILTEPPIGNTSDDWACPDNPVWEQFVKNTSGPSGRWRGYHAKGIPLFRLSTSPNDSKPRGTTGFQEMTEVGVTLGSDCASAWLQSVLRSLNVPTLMASLPLQRWTGSYVGQKDFPQPEAVVLEENMTLYCPVTDEMMISGDCMYEKPYSLLSGTARWLSMPDALAVAGSPGTQHDDGGQSALVFRYGLLCEIASNAEDPTFEAAAKDFYACSDEELKYYLKYSCVSADGNTLWDHDYLVGMGWKESLFDPPCTLQQRVAELRTAGLLPLTVAPGSSSGWGGPTNMFYVDFKDLRWGELYESLIYDKEFAYLAFLKKLFKWVVAGNEILVPEIKRRLENIHAALAELETPWTEGGDWNAFTADKYRTSQVLTGIEVERISARRQALSIYLEVHKVLPWSIFDMRTTLGGVEPEVALLLEASLVAWASVGGYPVTSEAGKLVEFLDLAFSEPCGQDPNSRELTDPRNDGRIPSVNRFGGIYDTNPLSPFSVAIEYLRRADAAWNLVAGGLDKDSIGHVVEDLPGWASWRFFLDEVPITNDMVSKWYQTCTFSPVRMGKYVWEEFEVCTPDGECTTIEKCVTGLIYSIYKHNPTHIWNNRKVEAGVASGLEMPVDCVPRLQDPFMGPFAHMDDGTPNCTCVLDDDGNCLKGNQAWCKLLELGAGCPGGTILNLLARMVAGKVPVFPTPEDLAVHLPDIQQDYDKMRLGVSFEALCHSGFTTGCGGVAALLQSVLRSINIPTYTGLGYPERSSERDWEVVGSQEAVDASTGQLIVDSQGHTINIPLFECHTHSDDSTPGKGHTGLYSPHLDAVVTHGDEVNMRAGFASKHFWIGRVMAATGGGTAVVCPGLSDAAVKAEQQRYSSAKKIVLDYVRIYYMALAMFEGVDDHRRAYLRKCFDDRCRAAFEFALSDEATTDGYSFKDLESVLEQGLSLPGSTEPLTVATLCNLLGQSGWIEEPTRPDCVPNSQEWPPRTLSAVRELAQQCGVIKKEDSEGLKCPSQQPDYPTPFTINGQFADKDSPDFINADNFRYFKFDCGSSPGTDDIIAMLQRADIHNMGPWFTEDC